MRRLILLLVSGSLLSCCSREDAIIILIPGAEYSAIQDSEIEFEEGKPVITAVNQLAGISFDGKWDLTDCRSVRFTVTNLCPEDVIGIYCFLENETVTQSLPSHGISEDRGYVEPDGTRTFEFDLPCRQPHPEVGDLLTLMKTSPYNEFKHFQYNVDLSDVRHIKISSNRQYPGSRWRLENLEFVKGERAETPDYMTLDSASFFPCYDRYGQFKYRDWPGKTHSDADMKASARKEARDLAKHPGPKGWNKYGGWADGPHFEATGHFRVQKVGGKWWMIDPDGCLFWSHGIVRVNPSSSVTPLHGAKLASRNYMFEDLPGQDDSLYRFYYTNDELLKPYYERWQEDSTYDFSSANLYRKYGPDYREIWDNLAHIRLRSWGCNTVANSSDIDICRMDRTPFIDRFDIRSKPIEGADGPWFPIMDPFDPSFRQAVTKALLDHKRDIEDPFLLGYFVDNEIKWGDSTHAARCVANAPESQAAKKAMRSFLKERYGRQIRPSDASEQDLADFNRIIIEEYYKVIRGCFDKYAPGVLYMGCRFAGFMASNPDVVTIGAEYCDVISHNQYRYTIDTYSLPEGVDKPVMVGEWHLGSLDRGMCHPSLIYTDNEEDRGRWYCKYAVSAMKHPNIIGIHWHQFMDQASSGRFDGENLHVGFLDCCDTPYQETIDAAREAGYRMYETRYYNK